MNSTGWDTDWDTDWDAAADRFDEEPDHGPRDPHVRAAVRGGRTAHAPRRPSDAGG